MVEPIPTELLLRKVDPFVSSTEPPDLTSPPTSTSPVIVAIPVTRSPSLAVITPTESIFVTSSYVYTPPTPRLPVIVALAAFIVPPLKLPENVVAVTTPEVILLTVKSLTLPSARKI